MISIISCKIFSDCQFIKKFVNSTSYLFYLIPFVRQIIIF